MSSRGASRAVAPALDLPGLDPPRVSALFILYEGPIGEWCLRCGDPVTRGQRVRIRPEGLEHTSCLIEDHRAEIVPARASFWRLLTIGALALIALLYVIRTIVQLQG